MGKLVPEHRHGEAFCLMWYRCDNCGHQERIWNSRDGVTPFGCTCPSCGELTLKHWRFDLDERATEHVLRSGQRFWRDGTPEEAKAALERRFKIFKERGQPVSEEVQAEMLADLEKPSDERWEFKDGWPMLDIQR